VVTNGLPVGAGPTGTSVPVEFRRYHPPAGGFGIFRAFGSHRELPRVGIARRVLLTSPQTRLHTVIVGLFGEFAMTTSPSLTFEKRGVTASIATERQDRAISSWDWSVASVTGRNPE
jgi:hypothetical protein